MSLDKTVDGLCLRDFALYFSHNFLRCANGKTPLKERHLKILILILIKKKKKKMLYSPPIQCSTFESCNSVQSTCIK